jgi:hypothetical protein
MRTSSANLCVNVYTDHCPWMNNCVGANNFSKSHQTTTMQNNYVVKLIIALICARIEHFVLFLCYTWTGCAFALILFGLNYFFCNSEDCVFPDLLILLVRVMTVFCFMTILFVSSMLLNVVYGIMTGIGTIDRLKKKANGSLYDAMDEPTPLKDVFGIQGYWAWILPIDPVFEDYDRIMGFSIPQRLIRERENDL